jgi:hypothetical protein
MQLQVNEQLLQVGRDLVHHGIGNSNGDRAREVMRALVGEVERIRREVNDGRYALNNKGG